MGRVDLTLQCMACKGMGREVIYAGRCACGARNWIETAPPAPRTPSPLAARDLTERSVPRGPSQRDEGFVDGTGVAPMIVDDFKGARLNEVLGGIKRGALLLLVGAAGAGKSTATAELAAAAAEHWSGPGAGREQRPRCPIHWLDADQRDPVLVRQCFITAGVERAFPGRIRLLPERKEPYAFEEALRRTPDDARVLVIDSLESWGKNDTVRLAQMIALRAHGAWLKVVIGGTNKLGGVSGVEAIARADDATLYAERTEEGEHTLRFTKRRWQPCAAARERGAGTPAKPAVKTLISASGGLATSAPAPIQPDFSPEFLAIAASWGVRETEAYRAQLRAGSVHRDSIEGWNRAVEEWQAHHGDDGAAGRVVLH
jgi:AAA domain